MISQIFTLGRVLGALMLIGLFGSGTAFAQSIQSGVTFQWADTQPDGNAPATLDGITVDGTEFNVLTVPSGYQMLQVGPGGPASNRILRGSTVAVSNSNDPAWNTIASQAFASRDLNFMFEADGSSNNTEICGNFAAIATTSNQIQRLSYGAGVRATRGAIIAVTERNANNCYYIRILGIPVGGGAEQILGGTFVRGGPLLNGSAVSTPSGGSDYWGSGRVNANNGTIGIAMFVLDPLVPVGSTITKVDFIAATRDHGDGKVFIMNSVSDIVANDDIISAVDGGPGAANIINVLNNDNLRGFAPTASSATISITNPAANPSVTIDPATGNVSVAAGVPPGIYKITYRICETANSNNCDTAVVTVPVVGLKVIKTSVVISDPVNGTANPKAISGALVRYCIQVMNEANSTTMEAINITDDLAAMPVIFQPGSIRLNGQIESAQCDYTSGSPGGAFSGTTVSAVLDNLPPGEARTMFFDVVMQ